MLFRLEVYSFVLVQVLLAGSLPSLVTNSYCARLRLVLQTPRFYLAWSAMIRRFSWDDEGEDEGADAAGAMREGIPGPVGPMREEERGRRR